MFNFDDFMDDLEQQLLNEIDFTKDDDEIYDDIQQAIYYTIDCACTYTDDCWSIARELQYGDFKEVIDEFGDVTRIEDLASGALTIEVFRALNIDELIEEAKKSLQEDVEQEDNESEVV